MIVLDASACLELLLGTPTGKKVAKWIRPPEEDVHVPHLLDLEIAQTLRRYVLNQVLVARRAELASIDDRRSCAGPAAERSRRDQRRAGRRHAALGAPVAGLRHRAAGTDRGRPRPDQRAQCQRGNRHAPHRGRAPTRRMDHRRALDVEPAETLLQRLGRS